MSTAFLDQAKLGRNQWWTYLLGLSVLVASAGSGPPIREIVSKAWSDLFFSAYSALFWYTSYIIHNLALGKLASLLCLIAVIRLVHRRSFLSLITTRDRVRWNLLIRGFGLYFLLFSAAMLIDNFVSSKDQFRLYLPAVAGREELSGLPLAIHISNTARHMTEPIRIIVSSTTEELFFRGYILQGLGLLTRNRVILALLVAFVFMVSHLSGQELHPLLVFEVGIFLTIVTLKSNGLELAIGMHIAHNLAGTLIAYGIGYKAVYLNILFPICAVIMYFIMFRHKVIEDPETGVAKNP